MSSREICSLIIGFLIGALPILFLFHFFIPQQQHKKFDYLSNICAREYSKRYNETLSKFLFNEVKVLCMVVTMPSNHEAKASVVKRTWGKRCNKLIFLSSEKDDALGTIVWSGEETRNHLWLKTRYGFKYLHEHYINDFDWFLKADDDNYIIVENLRYMLYQYNPKTALYFGHRYSVQGIPEGYMAGGGYILSNKALRKFSMLNETICPISGTAEDMEMGKCLAHSAIFVDCRDELLQKRFFPIYVQVHMSLNYIDADFWYWKNQYYNVTHGGLGCCSNTSVAFHYISPAGMLRLESFIYDSNPFGLETQLKEILPRKLSLNEIILRSDVKSPSENYEQHEDFHMIDSSEKVT